MKPFIHFVFIIFSAVVFAQKDTIHWRFSFQLDNKFSSIRKNDVTIFGAKVGVQYKNLTRLGLGTSFIINPVEISYINKRIGKLEQNNVSFWYFSVFNDWILYKNEKWELFLTEQIGFGKPSLTRSVGDDVISDIHVNLYVNEFSAQVNYKIMPWLGAGAGFGYRKILNKNHLLNATFNAPIYILKIIVYPEVILRKSK